MELKITGRQIESPLKAVGKAGEPIALVFKMPRYYEGKDLSNGTIYMAVVKDAESQTHVLDKVVLEDEIQAIWNGSFNFPGAITVALKISDMEAELWKSYPVAMTVAEGEARPMMMRSFAAPRIAVPDDEEPITVSERTIVVPTELQNIAVQNDENSETVKIVIPRYFDGHDLDQYTAVLKTVSSGGRDDLNLDKIGADDSELTFEWTLAPPQTSYAGKLEIQIRFVGEDFKWETDSAIVNIITSLDDDPIVPTTPSIIESLIQQVSSYANSASASAVLAINSAQEAKEAAETVGETVSGLVTDAQNAADRAESAATRAENVQADGDAIIASARAQATAAANSATQASGFANRAEVAAERAEQIAGGDFATHAEVGVVQTNLNNHINDKANPHEVTKAQVGLGNVDNTSDMSKPVSTAQRTAIDAKASVANYTATIPASNWTNNASGGYMAICTCNGLLSSDTPIVDIVLGSSATTNIGLLEAWGMISHIDVAADNVFYVYAPEEKPTVNISVQFKVVR